VTGGRSVSGTPSAPVRAIVDELVMAGLRDVVVCPGSRSTPITLAVAVDPRIRTWTHIDERAAGYFAIGLAKASRRAVAVVVTSGTAPVNLHPAVAEAFEGRVPLLILSADRPPELRDRGAPQTTNQQSLFGHHSKWFAELPVPDEDPKLEAHVRGVIARAVAVATESPSGPVHLNLPFQEPLIPVGSLRSGIDESIGASATITSGSTGGEPYLRFIAPDRKLPASAITDLVIRLRRASRGLIVCGPIDRVGFAASIADLARVTGYPILADGLANVRTGPHDRSHVIARHDTVLRSERVRDERRPDLIIRFGGTPTSKTLLTWLGDLEAEQVVVDDMGWNEPTLRPATFIHADPARLAADLAAEITRSSVAPDRGWLDGWQAADRAADAALGAWLTGIDQAFEGAAIAGLADGLPDGTILYVGSSMPVRDLDAYLPSSETVLRCMGNRGANGIDGVISSGLGAAACGEGPVILVVGDVSFLHDLNALVAARLNRLDATIVLVNNDGGGIFSFLPQASADRPDVGLPEHYERLFGTPHAIEFGPIVAALGGEHRLVGSGELSTAVRGSVGRPGVRVFELRTERKRNVELHRAAVTAAVEAVEASLDAAVGP